jgi:hypothetical protein
MSFEIITGRSTRAKSCIPVIFFLQIHLRYAHVETGFSIIEN